MLAMMRDDIRLFKLFFNNPDFRRWLEDTAFRLAYEATGWRARAALQDPSGMFSPPRWRRPPPATLRYWTSSYVIDQ